MSDVATSATIASLRAEVERLKAELQGEREDLAACYKAKAHLVDAVGEAQMQEAACRAEVNRLSKYAERLLAENVRLSNDAATARERAGVLEAEVKACRLYDEAITADEQEVGWQAKDTCRRETDRTHALDAAKFGGAT